MAAICKHSAPAFTAATAPVPVRRPRSLVVRAVANAPHQADPSDSSSRRALLAAAAALAAAPLAAAPPAAAAPAPRVFFDFLVDGKPFGRVVIAADGASPLATRRFLDLTEGREGVGYRRTRVELLQDGYVQDPGVKALSYKASGATAITGGPDAEEVETELHRSAARHDGPGVVSLVVRRGDERETKEKLVAVNGQLVTVTEVLGDTPNGSGFAITTRAAPELDATHLVVGHVVEGQAVVDALAALPRVKDNSESPFFKAGKAAGDKRASVAERAFGKPFAKIVVEGCGLLE